jgi:hypothetical protein
MNQPNELLRYAGMATQFLVLIGMATYLGFKADAYFWRGSHILIVSLPLLIIIVSFYKIFKDTQHEK